MKQVAFRQFVFCHTTLENVLDPRRDKGVPRELKEESALLLDRIKGRVQGLSCGGSVLDDS